MHERGEDKRYSSKKQKDKKSIIGDQFFNFGLAVGIASLDGRPSYSNFRHESLDSHT